jgi:formate hydrogenlyase transcriptional activator
VPTTKPMPESDSEQPQLGAVESVREQLKFEILLADLSARFVNVLANQIDREIESAQKSICDHLDLDGSAVWQQFGEDPEFFHMTHLYRPLGGPPVPERFVGTDYFPWVQKRLLSNEIVKVPDTKDVPPEAARDREVWDYYDIKSCVNFPFWTGHDRMFGCISFQTTRERRDWPEALVNRLKLLAQVFAGALARKRAEKSLHDSELRLRLAAAAAGAGLWTLETVSGRIWATDKTKELFGFAPTEEFDLEKFLAIVHPEDREAVRGSIEQAIHSGEDSSIEYRIIRPDRETRWISARGCRRSGEFGEPDQLMGVSVDVTERKQLEAVLRESNAQLTGIVTSAMDAIIAIDEDQHIVVFNVAAEKVFGCSAREAIGSPVGRFIPQRFQADHREHIRKFGETGVTNRSMGTRDALWAVRSNGEEFLIEASISQVHADRKRLYTVIIRDVTESKRAEEELQRSYAEVKRLEERLRAESVYLREEIKEIGKFHEIVGQSKAIKEVLRKVEQVACTDSLVLITGETGTGKELIARAIHNLSMRKAHVMVKVDCAALPPTLIESELFGREKGAYTGALSKQLGRFETADGSTLFLDEIGELGVEVQAKLLRVVQDGEFERLGSPKTSHVNVRFIAATHRDLAERVKNGAFREDLFYRLNVFPIRVPPLRERPEDIPLLVMAFLREFEKKMSKRIRGVPSRLMDELKIYSWPGNIRELRNVIERAVIVTTGEKLSLELPKSLIAPRARTLKEAEYQHILAILEKTGWRIKGPNGAATILGVKPSTLYTAMRRLHIPTGHEKDGIQS